MKMERGSMNGEIWILNLAAMRRIELALAVLWMRLHGCVDFAEQF
jgi:hypothetical protein